MGGCRVSCHSLRACARARARAAASAGLAASPASLREGKIDALMQTLRETAKALRALGVTGEELRRGLEEEEHD